MASAFAPLADQHGDLPEAIAAYVASGDRADVLHRVSTAPEFAEVVGCESYGFFRTERARPPQRELWCALGDWPAGAILRLALVVRAGLAPTLTGGHHRISVESFANGLEWLDLFLQRITGSHPGVWSSRAAPAPVVSLRVIEEMVAANHQDRAALARGALPSSGSKWGWASARAMFCSFPDLKDLLERHTAVVRAAFAGPELAARVHALETLAAAGADPRIWREEIAAFAVGSSKTLRQAAEPLVRLALPEFRPLLERHLLEGDNDTRGTAAQVMLRIFGEDVRGLLRARRAIEKSKKVQQVLDDLLGTADPAGGAAADASGGLPAAHAVPASEDWNLPPLPEFSLVAPLPASVRQAMDACLLQAYGEARAHYHRIAHERWAGKFELVVNEGTVDSAFAALQYGGTVGSHQKPPSAAWRAGVTRLWEFAGHPDFTLLHLVRWCALWLGPPEEWWFNHASPAFNAFGKTHPRPGLREIGAAFAAVGWDPDIVGRQYLGRNTYGGETGAFRQPPESVWPYFAERLTLLEAALRPVTPSTDFMARYRAERERDSALSVLALFPRTPRKLVPLLWEIALTGAKGERRRAQSALAHESDLVAQLVAKLSHRQAETRAEAAGWLQRLRAPAAEKALRAALRKERKEVVQGALMRALESLGIPLDELVDRPALEAEAEKQAGKELPADLSWFPFATMPAVRWAGGRGVVSPNLLRLLLVQAFKLKNPEPGPLLRTYAELFHVEDRAALGRFVADAWLAQDTIPAHTAEEAAKLARAQTQQWAQYAQQWAAQGGPAWDEEKHYRTTYAHLLTVCKGSAIGSKGILALAGAFGSGAIAPAVMRYVKQYYGLRVAQCKALLQFLAWIDDPNAIQVLLAIGNRFRTKSIQEEATRLCQALAERKNWTLDELGDRTIPTAGLDEDGVLELDFGRRVFTARLSADLGLALCNSDGKEIGSLPEPNLSDDAELAKAAKQSWSAARKDLKTVRKLQEERLYEAMCTQREWAFGDFRRFLLAHPIVGRLCTGLVWSVVAEGRTTATFRPLPDRTLTNTDDDAVVFPDNARVRLAHEVTVAPAVRDAWLDHLADYKVEPLFPQFGKSAFVLPESRRDETALADFRGHMLENFKLRGRLTKLGYTRGQAMDGGWFYDYHKRFPGLGVQVSINFSGSPLPEENRVVALQELVFRRLGEDVGGDDALRLGDLPAVLLSECWNDLRLAAADGTGFDPEWEKKTQN